MALPSKLNLEIVTPEREVFSGPVDEVTVPGAAGELGILPGHAPLISQLGVGVVSYRRAGETGRLYCSSGFVEVLPDAVSILADEARYGKEIDAARAEQEKAEAENQLRSREPGTDYEAASRRYHEAVARMRVAGA